MTGFARLERSGAFGTLVCEIRSVNHRFLDATVRLPDSCRALESDLRHALSKELRRGKVDCTIQHRAPVAAALQIDEAALAPLVDRSRAIVKQLWDSAPHVNVIDLLRWPGVLREEQGDPVALSAAVQEIFAAAVAGLSAARAREGQRLGELIVQRCDALAALIAQVRARLPEVLARVRSRLEERLTELGGGLNQERIEQEIVLLLHRLDVAEELDRLTGHIEEARRTLAAPEAAGRRLDFLLQEFNREANTLASKSQDLETTRIAVEMKVAIEQMREQVQNIE
ncbi:MAG: YicC/YloC family endoribonuclease [Steroidobacteraceae bacterium]